jgi:hypothetical protein
VRTEPLKANSAQRTTTVSAARLLTLVNTLADAKTSEEYRMTNSDAETLSLWQVITFEASNLCCATAWRSVRQEANG